MDLGEEELPEEQDSRGEDGGVEQEDSSSDSNFQGWVILVGLFMMGLDAKSISRANSPSSFNPDMLSNTVPMK